MPAILGLDEQKCQRRNILAAKRDNVEAFPMQFLRGPVKKGAGTTHSIGTLPETDEAAMAIINARLPGETILTINNVWIHHMEAASGVFIPDRHGFLSTKTLKNIQKDADAGFSFMNGHRTGGFSHQSELPYGKAFAGRYEKDENGNERTLISAYFLKDHYPNGRTGPSTDDLHKGIEGGTITDVSVGLHGGNVICSVCGGDMDDWEECPHVPGSDYGMSDEDKEAAVARGVPDACASYILDNANCHETSAVYSGAIPGAGFRKGLAAIKENKLSQTQKLQFNRNYSNLLPGSNEAMDEDKTLLDAFKQFMAQHGFSFGKNIAPAALPNALPALPAPDNTINTAHTEIVAAANKAGITNAAQFADLLAHADTGKAFLATHQKEAKMYAVIAFGLESEEARKHVAEANALIDAAPLSVLSAIMTNFKSIAVSKGYQTETGAAPPRQTAGGQLPNHAADSTPPAPADPKIAEPRPAGDIYAFRAQQSLLAAKTQ